MKFHCDQCKTRYSIGEDRVRGKVLKIRCKNCGNVISVREGMDAEEPAGSARSGGTTSPAPAALEEEWYVSIDGVQSGPFSLVEAQRWVSSKAIDADLYCWREGFDDWLSVDKVSHFRNLRKPAAPPMPARPPIPRAATAAPPPIPAATAPKRDEAKPLFASTMAAIEKDASSSGSGPVLAASAPSAAAKQTTTPRVNGAGASGAMPAATGATGKGSGPVAAIPEPRTRTPSGRFQTLKASSATAMALSDAFDPEEPSDSATQVGVAPPMFGEDASPSSPVASPKGFDFGSMSDPNVKVTPAATKPAPVPLSSLGAPKPNKSVQQALDDEDDDLSIGEVSRVVNLKDIVAPPRARTSTASGAPISTGALPKVGSATGSVPRMAAQSNPRMSGAVPKIGSQTSSLPKFSPTDLGMNVDPSLAAPDGPAPDESLVAHTYKQKHRRGFFALIGFAAALVAGVIVLVVVMTRRNDDDFAGRLGDTRVIDTSRPEDIVRNQLEKPAETGSATGSATTKTVIKYVPRPNSNPNPPDDEPKGDTLRASEIEDMAAKNGEGTKRCYMRAQKGAIGFEIADVKKIAVTLTVGKDGSVNNVDLSSHGNDSFGQCLIARIKSWKFRESPGGGTFRISLAFSNG